MTTWEKAMKITDEVSILDCTKGAYVYAVMGKDGVTLIDSCFPGKGEAILAELAAAGIKPGDVKRILLTHHDIDHIGSAAFLQEKTGCEIYIHPADYPYVMEGKKREGIKRIIGALMKPGRPKEVKRIEGNTIGEFAVIPTPGHTGGHTAYRYRGVLFLGDLIRSTGGRPAMSPQIMTWDKEVLAASIKTLPTGGAEWLCPAHGKPVRADAWDAFVKSL